MSRRHRRAPIWEKGPGVEPSKPTKVGFDGFVGSDPGAFPPNGMSEAAYCVQATADTDPVVVTVAIRRDCLVRAMPTASRWDGVLFLVLVERFCGTVDTTRRAIH